MKIKHTPSQIELVILSFVAGAIGTIVFSILAEMGAYLVHADLFFCIMIPIVAMCYVGVIWGCLLVPLVLVVPHRSILWNPFILLVGGSLGGPFLAVSIVFVLTYLDHVIPAMVWNEKIQIIMLLAPAIMGGVTGLSGGLLHRWLLAGKFIFILDAWGDLMCEWFE